MASFNLLLLGLPAKTFVGVNLVSFTSSPNFRGIIHLPTGLHFIYTGTDATLSIRHGTWIEVGAQKTSQKTTVMKWNSEHESLELLSSTDETAVSACQTISSSSPPLYGHGLVDYQALRTAQADLQRSQLNDTATIPSSRPNKTIGTNREEEQDPWPDLVSHVSAHTLTRVLSAEDGDQHDWNLSSISSCEADEERIPGLTNVEQSTVLQDAGQSTLKFLPINLKQTWPDDSFGADRTEKARDKSWYLAHLISSLSGEATSTDILHNVGASELLAELQICFVMVLTLANYSCLEQWKRLLGVILGSKAAIRRAEGYFVQAITILQTQLQRIEDVEGGLFELADELASRWLRLLLKTFHDNVNEMVRDSRRSPLSTVLVKLEAWLRDTYGWADEGSILKRGMLELEDGEQVEVQMDGLDQEEESGEYAPIVVET